MFYGFLNVSREDAVYKYWTCMSPYFIIDRLVEAPENKSKTYFLSLKHKVVQEVWT